MLERLGRCSTLLIDKTGTLTSGRPALVATMAAGQFSSQEVLTMAASIDQVSPHVLASAIVQAAVSQNCDLVLPRDVEEAAGQGLRGNVDGHLVAVGTGRLGGRGRRRGLGQGGATASAP